MDVITFAAAMGPSASRTIRISGSNHLITEAQSGVAIVLSCRYGLVPILDTTESGQ
ncbi:hypothetical protein [Bacillus litorisediminis]|uniref:hypothetical protein n=1 Tax=Bacillus litorisediminis TaxID=2922713 RepID=UPI001FAE9818|nr:hypothetical protein [Bacillus litorisediminis]